MDGGSSTGLERYADAAAQADVLVKKQCVASDVDQVVKTAPTTRYAWVMGEKWQYMQRRLETLHQFRTGFVAKIFVSVNRNVFADRSKVGSMVLSVPTQEK